MAGRLGGMKGGGFLNNVDGLIEGYKLTDAFPGKQPDPDDPQVFMVVTVKPDGASESKTTTLRAGSGAYLSISKDGQSLTNTDGGVPRIWDKSDLYHFLTSVHNAQGGIADGGIDDGDETVLSFGGLNGRRMRFVQEKDEARMEARRKNGQNPKNVVEKDGVKKEYDFTRLVVETVYPGVTTVANASKGAKGKVAAKAATAPAVDIEVETTTALLNILQSEGGTIQRSQIAMLVTKGLTTNPNREAIRKRMFSEDFLTKEDGWSFDQSGKTQAISLN